MNRLTICFLLVAMSAPPDFAKAQTSGYVFSTLAGAVGISGTADGTNQVARFSSPGNIVVDDSGNLFLSDVFNNTIRKITPVTTNWVVTTIAGIAGGQGITDGTNSDALFDRPNGIALDRAGNLFVADHYNHTIRKLTPSGTNWIVTTIAGLAAVHGSADGTNTDARFWSPTGIAVDTNDNLYVVDTANFTIRQVSPIGTNWVVTTIAGSVLNYGFVDGTNSDAEFDYPYGITIDNAGSLYVTDWGNNAIRQLDRSGTNWVVNTIAGVLGIMGSVDGSGTVAALNLPNSICADKAGNLYVTDQANDTIRQLVRSGTNWNVSTIAGAPLKVGNADGLASNARFRLPWGIAVGTDGKLYVTDYGNQTIRLGQFVTALRIGTFLQKLIFSWPAQAEGYVLETSESLGSNATWSPLTNAPSSNGSNLVLALEPGKASSVYRLRYRPAGSIP